ncbi:putative cell number regulator [Cavenderia fasciculata]|uniref:Cell number regulator n=1 Tax=Cavenderia fasciculata TaxID=261658 RepID=F4PTF6_CACFS|nr:putative cell number regulator [Cavenderia fasciculata]EGG21678.1 putative cell number regulator [Cavenderia fasciculata]|eukprot:XP_004359528.1 putative cell number regulator [Cavenderia fasciculata]
MNKNRLNFGTSGGRSSGGFTLTRQLLVACVAFVVITMILISNMSQKDGGGSSVVGQRQGQATVTGQASKQPTPEEMRENLDRALGTATHYRQKRRHANPENRYLNDDNARDVALQYWSPKIVDRRRKRLTDEEQMEANREKALASKQTEDERLRIQELVISDVNREVAFVESLMQSGIKIDEYAAVPYVDREAYPMYPLNANSSADFKNSMEWKQDPTKNPFLMPHPYIFVHVPKTGGSSLANIFKRNERRDKFHHFWMRPSYQEVQYISYLNIIYGHIRFGLHHYYEAEQPGRLGVLASEEMNPYSYMTMLREPVDRVISHYYYHRQNRRDPGHALSMKYTLDDWLDHTGAATNEQAHMLCGIASTDTNDNPEFLSKCSHYHLQYVYKYVGLTEKFPESLVLLTHYTGFQAIRFSKINTGTQRLKVEDIDPNVIEKIKRLNAIDISLYNMAVDIFEKSVDAVGREFVTYQSDLLKDKIRQYLPSKKI